MFILIKSFWPKMLSKNGSRVFLIRSTERSILSLVIPSKLTIVSSLEKRLNTNKGSM